MTELNTKEDKFAGMPRFFQRRGDYLYFSCIAPDFKIRLCRYDENKGEVEVFLLNPNEDKYKVMPFFKIVGDDIIMELHDEATLSNNPLLLIYDINKL